jgi:hypothetical protein
MKYQEFKNALNKPYFRKLDILIHSLTVFDYQLSLWKKKGYIESVKRDLFVFSDEKEKLSSEEISSMLYEPSYLSLEFVLGYYGIIPEMVFAKTAVTTKTTRKFSNGFGLFVYRHIQPKLFFGYVAVDTAFGKYLLAEPEKALLDYLYFNLGKINNEQDVAELRINKEELLKIIDQKKLETYLGEFGTKKLERVIRMII